MEKERSLFAMSINKRNIKSLFWNLLIKAYQKSNTCADVNKAAKTRLVKICQLSHDTYDFLILDGKVCLESSKFTYS